MAKVICCRGLSKAFGKVPVLEDVSFEVESGEIHVIAGESGCGKTTLLRILAGLETYDRGEGVVNGNPLGSVPPYRLGVSIAFQHPSLWPHMTVRKNVAVAMDRPDPNRIAELLDLFGIGELAERYPHEISGGQARRASIVRSLAPKRPVLLLDEPLAHLGLEMARNVQEAVLDQVRSEGVAVIWTSHQKEFAEIHGFNCSYLPCRNCL